MRANDFLQFDLEQCRGNVPGVHFVYFLLRQFILEVEYEFERTKNNIG